MIYTISYYEEIKDYFLGGKAAHEKMGPPLGGGRPDFHREEFRRGGGGGRGTRGGRPF